MPQGQAKLQECIQSQQQWRQIHHLCYWELMWAHCFQQDWLEAYRYADLLCKESKWSQVRSHMLSHTHTHTQRSSAWRTTAKQTFEGLC